MTSARGRLAQDTYRSAALKRACALTAEPLESGPVRRAEAFFVPDGIPVSP